MDLFNDTRKFFRELVGLIWQRRKLKEDEPLEDYLAGVLERFLRDDKILHDPQALLDNLEEKLETLQNPTEEFASVRKAGDASLFIAGIIAPHTRRSLLGVRHYLHLGKNAYRILYLRSDKDNQLSVVYQTLAGDLRIFARVLQEISEECFFKNYLEAWEKYKTGQPLTEDELKWLEHCRVRILPDPERKIIL